jgi:histidinol dehydrogenase
MVQVLTDPGAAMTRLRQIEERISSTSVEAAEATVREVIASVRARGDAAIREYTARFDHVELSDLQVPKQAIEASWDAAPQELRDALQLAHRRITAFHREQLPRDIERTGTHGEQLGRRWRAVQRAGLYVPGGRAAYPSTVLMNAIPAQVAGVKRLVMTTPPGPDGKVNPAVLAAARVAGISEIYSIGGAQAIAAMAWGSETIPAVDVITGPGNLYVTLAKKAVYGRVGIDSLAGPSEVLIIADDTADAELVAADLLAQAEHDPMAAAILLTTSDRLLQEVPGQLQQQLLDHPRKEVTEASIRDWGLIVHCSDLDQAAELSDCFAPEHLELLVADPRSLAERIQQAGAIFIGSHSPEAAGDYLAGPNHTLPTSGTARFSGALSVETFMRHTSLINFNREALEATGAAIMTLAASEGLHSHRESVRRRLQR